MTSDELDFIRAAYASPDGLAVFADRVAPDAVFDFSDAYPDGPVVQGPDAARRFREQGPWAEIRFDPERLIEVDQARVLVLVRVRLVGAGSGTPVEHPAAHLITVRDGMLTGFKVYLDRAAALAEADLA
ncbi:MAG: nuclear transport factor 2 family protein [Solirubrobacterales bacterium]